MAKTATNAAHVRFYYVKCLLGPTGPHTLHTDKDYNSNLRCLLSAVCSCCHCYCCFSADSVGFFLFLQMFNCHCLRLSHFTFHVHSVSVSVSVTFTFRMPSLCILFYARAKKYATHNLLSDVLLGLPLHLPLSAHSTPLQLRLTVRCFCARANWQPRQFHPHTSGTAERITRGESRGESFLPS